MSNWAGIVYSRTYEVDFRFLAVPEDFTNEDRDWAGNYIRVTTRAAEQLPGNPRWSVFKNEQYCVVGVTCMMRELLAPLDATTEQLIRDSQGRPLYIFVGYVARADDETRRFPTLPLYLDKDLELFKPLRRFLEPRWLVKTYDTERNVVARSHYEEGLTSQSLELIPDFDEDNYYSLNQTLDNVVLWPDSAEDIRRRLWTVSAHRINNEPSISLSLLLGMSTRRDVLESPVLNATVADVRQKELVEKQPIISSRPESQWTQPVSGAIEQRQPVESRRREQRRPRSASGRTALKSLAALGGGTLGGGIGAGLAVGRVGGIAGPIPAVVGFVCGAAVGWVVVDLLDDAVRGEISQRTSEFIDSCSETVFNNREQEQPSRNRRSGTTNHQGSSDQQDSLYGFRRRDEQQSSDNSESSNDDDSTWNL